MQVGLVGVIFFARRGFARAGGAALAWAPRPALGPCHRPSPALPVRPITLVQKSVYFDLVFGLVRPK